MITSKLPTCNLKAIALAFTLSCATVISTALPAKAAERIYLRLGPAQLTVAVRSLEQFVETGEVAPDLRIFLNRLNPVQQQRLRGLLQSPYEIDPQRLSQILYMSTGIRILRFVGDNLVQSADGQSGFYGTRSALVLAAADPQKLTLLNFLQKFPTDIRVNVGEVLYRMREISQLVQQTRHAIQDLEQQTTALKATEPSINFAQKPDLRIPGQWSVEQRVLHLRDAQRDRPILVDLYLPQGFNQETLPVIVVSNGLAAKRDRFGALAQHLASHGFAVVIPDHPGSSHSRQQAFYTWQYAENFDSADFVDRPLDITFVLNELERLNASEFQGRLNLKQVGMFGYSYGATTALSLTGAEIDYTQLEQACDRISTLVNISLLYQCRALEPPRRSIPLQDSRIQAAYLFVPFGNTLFGKDGLDRVTVPIFWQAVDQDFITPLLIEQLPLFARLKNTERYLAVSERLPHARVTLGFTNQVTNQTVSPEVVGRVTQTYVNALTLAFFKTYISQDEAYRPYLSASYADVLDEEPYDLTFTH